ncbi:MAG: serine/threonine-protein kinase [Bryobacterales bacterium]
MTPERLTRIQGWFHRLVNLPLEESRRELEKLETDDPELCREVEDLLWSDQHADNFLKHALRSGSDRTSNVSEQRRDRVGQTISHYRIESRLGGGGMGVVYKAQDLRLDRYVALKFLPPATDDDEERLKRLIVEARATSTLDHPNICTVHQIDQTDDGHWFIVMAYYNGETLKKRIERGTMQVAEVLDFGAQMSRGLVKAHKEGIVHRDLKPANVMVTKEGVIKIVDFGLAQLVAQTKLTAPGTRLGTPAYMSPEQAQGQTVDHRTDIWSLGVVLYEMLAGRSPFKGEYELAVIYSIVNEEPPSLATQRPDAPTALVRLVEKALSKDPKDRYQQVEELSRELEALQGHRTMVRGATTLPTPIPTGSAPATAARGDQRLIYLGLATAVAVVIAMVMIFMAREPSAEQAASLPPAAVTKEAAPADTTGAVEAANAPAAVEVQPEATRETPTAAPQTPAATPQTPAAAVTRPPAVRPPPAVVSPPAATSAPPKAQPVVKEPAATKTARDEAPAAAPTRPEVVADEPPPRPTASDLAAQELAAWTRIRGNDDIASFESFLRDNPNGALRQEAQARIDDLKWQAARVSNDAAVLERYVLQNPNSRYVGQAQARLKEMRPPAPVEPAPAPAPVAKAEPPPAPRPSEADAIRDVLRRYGVAYRARDVAQVTALWPTLTADQVRRIADSFRVAASIELDLVPQADPEIREDQATVRCRRLIRYADERGPQRPIDEVVTVAMRKRQGAWFIEAVN